MSRSKKSRKPGSAPTAKAKLSKQELDNVEKRVRKKKGKQAGNRQQEATQSENITTQQSANQDYRLGNKTPIALGKLVAKAEKVKTTALQKPPRIAAIRIAEQNSEQITAQEKENAEHKRPILSPAEEIDAIEQDEKLQTILAKQEDDIALTEQEVDYYNELMERHEQLSAELNDGEDYSDEDDEDRSADTEDDLWDKLDRSIDKNDISHFKG